MSIYLQNKWSSGLSASEWQEHTLLFQEHVPYVMWQAEAKILGDPLA